MKPAQPASRRRALRLYALAQGVILLGAALMTWLDSYLPLALAGSAALMLTTPLVRDIAARGLALRRRR